MDLVTRFTQYVPDAVLAAGALWAALRWILEPRLRAVVHAELQDPVKRLSDAERSARDHGLRLVAVEGRTAALEATVAGTPAMLETLKTLTRQAEAAARWQEMHADRLTTVMREIAELRGELRAREGSS